MTVTPPDPDPEITFPFRTDYVPQNLAAGIPGDINHTGWHNKIGWWLNNKVAQLTGAVFGDEASVTLTSRPPTPRISRLLTFRMTGIDDRPWISWLDEASRHRVAMGYHSRDSVSLAMHNAFEVKISTSPLAANPADMRTRLSFSTDEEIGTVDFPSNQTIQINRGIYSANDSFGYLLRTPDSTGTSRKIGQFLASLDGSDNTTVYLDALTATTADTATVKVFRSSSSAVAGGVRFILKKGDGTDTDAFNFDVGRGRLFIANGAAPASAPVGGAYLWVEGGAVKAMGSSGTVVTVAS